MRKLFLPLVLFLVLCVPFNQLQSQTNAEQTLSPAVINEEKLLYIGMTLAELIEKLGAPAAVAAVRGNETWQDDVVFQYTDADFFIHRDRVWQARFSSACGISVRDRKAAALLILGSSAEDNGNYAVLSIPRADAGTDRNWPLTLRVNFNDSGQARNAAVTSIFIYRPDF